MVNVAANLVDQFDEIVILPVDVSDDSKRLLYFHDVRFSFCLKIDLPKIFLALAISSKNSYLESLPYLFRNLCNVL